jgi:predicted CopG family antitoxin
MLDNPKSVKKGVQSKGVKKKRVTISIYEDTKKRLENFGRMNQSYDDVINQLFDERDVGSR